MSNMGISQRKLRQGFAFPSRGRILIYLCALVIVCWSVGPFLWQMSTSLQPDRELLSSTPHFIPYPITLEHFLNIFVAKSFHRYIINSAIVTVVTTCLCLLFGSIAAYAIARLEIRGRYQVLGLFSESRCFRKSPLSVRFTYWALTLAGSIPTVF